MCIVESMTVFVQSEFECEKNKIALCSLKFMMSTSALELQIKEMKTNCCVGRLFHIPTFYCDRPRQGGDKVKGRAASVTLTNEQPSDIFTILMPANNSDIKEMILTVTII